MAGIAMWPVASLDGYRPCPGGFGLGAESRLQFANVALAKRYEWGFLFHSQFTVINTDSTNITSRRVVDSFKSVTYAI